MQENETIANPTNKKMKQEAPEQTFNQQMITGQDMKQDSILHFVADTENGAMTLEQPVVQAAVSGDKEMIDTELSKVKEESIDKPQRASSLQHNGNSSLALKRESSSKPSALKREQSLEVQRAIKQIQVAPQTTQKIVEMLREVKMQSLTKEVSFGP